MTIEFECLTNKRIQCVDFAIFSINGEETVIDRDHTEYIYDPDTGTVNMQWSGLYIWDGENENYDIPENFAEIAKFKSLEVEDDADEDYRIECIHVWVDDEEKSTEIFSADVLESV